jgi:hypothetical protein
VLVGRGIVQDEDQFRGRLPRPRVHVHGIYVQAPVSALLGHYFEMSILWTHLRRLVLAIKAPNHMAPLALFSMWILSTFLKHAPTRKNSHVPDIPPNNSRLPTFPVSGAGRSSSRRPMPHSVSVSYTSTPAGSGYSRRAARIAGESVTAAAVREMFEET